jgi:hypothetical protein
MLLWLLSGAAVVVAAASLVRASRVSRRLQRLTQSYWELRYEHDRLQARFDRVSPAEGAAQVPPPPQAGTAFVPLSSVRR